MCVCVCVCVLEREEIDIVVVVSYSQGECTAAMNVRGRWEVIYTSVCPRTSCKREMGGDIYQCVP